MWTNILMFTLRFFAGPIVHRISPLGLLFCSATLGAAGLIWLGRPETEGSWAWMAAVTVYGLGKTFYWPTMLGVISERYPKGGALALGISGGVGMLSAGLFGSPIIGYQQDYAATRDLDEHAPDTYRRYKADEPTAPLPFLPQIAGIDKGKVGVLENYIKIEKKAEEAQKTNTTLKNEDLELDLAKDLALLQKQGEKNDELQKRYDWWLREGRENAEVDNPRLEAAIVKGGKQALTWTAAVPGAMALGYLFLILVFKLKGGYQQVHIDQEHH
jgi:hypothetical protein